MPKPPKTRRLVLDRQHLVQMLGDPAFFDKCVPFEWLRPTALLQTAAYRQSEEDSCCGGNWKLMAAIAQAFYQHLRKLHADDPQQVECVRDFLTGKKGYIAKPCVVFYRPTDSSRPNHFSF